MSTGSFDKEKKVLQKIREIPHVTKLVDLVQKDNTSYMLISIGTGTTVDALMHEYHTNTASQNVSLLDFAFATIA